MKILLFTSRFLPHIGGVEKVVEFLVNNLNDDLCLITSLDQKGFKVCKKIPCDKYDHYRVWMGCPSSFLGVLAYPYRFILSIIYLIKIIKKFNPDLVNYHFPDDSIFQFEILRRFVKFKYYVNIHGNDLHLYSKKFPHKYLYNKMLSSANGIIVNSEYMIEELLSKYSFLVDKVQIIPNAIDIDSISDFKVQKPTDMKYAFFVGRMVEKKGVDIMLRAFAKSNIEDLVLVIEGNGEKLSDLKKLALDLSIIDKVIFTEGKLTEEQKFGYMKGAQFGVIPSIIEPFGIVALEFMAAKIPIIASNTGGLKKLIVDGENGLLFENMNIDDLSHKLRYLFENEDLGKRLAQSGFNYAKNFDKKVVIEKYKYIFVDKKV